MMEITYTIIVVNDWILDKLNNFLIYLFYYIQQDVPGFYSALGAAFISLAIISSGFSKILNNLDEKHWLRSIYFLEWLYDVKPQMEKQTEEQYK